MNGCELPVGITALAVTIAAQIDDPNELSLIAAALTQLGDTLATIGAQRAWWQNKQTEAANTEGKDSTQSEGSTA